MSETRRVPLGRSGEHEAVVSAEDYEWLTQWRWSFKRSSWKYGDKIYARRCVWRDGKKVTLYMHIEIITLRMGLPCPGDGYEVDHEDIDSLNNARPNLRWLTKAANNANQNRKFATAAARERHAAAAAGHEEIPF